MIGVVFSKLFHALIAESQFQEILKVARVTRIFKARFKEIINNYHPISTLQIQRQFANMNQRHKMSVTDNEWKHN